MIEKEEVQILYMFVLNIHKIVIKAYKSGDLNEAFYLVDYEKKTYEKMLAILNEARYKDFFCFNMYQEVLLKMNDINYAIGKFESMKNVLPKLKKKKYHYSLLLLQKNNFCNKLCFSSFSNEGQRVIKSNINKIKSGLNKN